MTPDNKPAPKGEEVGCGTFMDWSFGGVLRKIRIHNNLTMRDMCRRVGIDVGNYSKLEAGKLSPPNSRRKIKTLLKDLDVYEWQEQQLYAASYNFHLGVLHAKFER